MKQSSEMMNQCVHVHSYVCVVLLWQGKSSAKIKHEFKAMQRYLQHFKLVGLSAS